MGFNAAKIVPIVILFLTPFFLGSIVSINPATDEEEVILVPVVKERNIGKKIDEQVRKQYKMPVDPLLDQRVKQIGDSLALCTDRKDLVYRFKVLEDEKDNNYNAFAAPGGYIYIFSDLMEALKTDDNTAAVLSHEMAHVEAKHSVKRMQANLGVTALLLLGTQIEAEQGTYAALGNAIGQLMSAYSRKDERQADELSVKYLRLAGFDAYGTIRALETLRDFRKKAPTRRYSYFRSHPYLSERISYLKKYITGHMDFDSYINMPPARDGL
ncbi:MAG: M48 family metallopeptidase [Candidatus Omnitrophota bacterium]